MKIISLVFLFVTAVFAQDNTLYLIDKLGDNSFKVREGAQKKLSDIIDFELYIYMKHRKKDEKDSEIQRRLEIINQDYERKLRSEYKVDLKDYKAYPQIDEGMPQGYKLGGPWKGLDRDHLISRYMEKAELNKTNKDYYPFNMQYRRATEILMTERIDYDFKESVKNSNFEKDFRNEMAKRMDTIQKDVEEFIDNDKKYYTKKKIKNPFLENN